MRLFLYQYRAHMVSIPAGFTPDITDEITLTTDIVRQNAMRRGNKAAIIFMGRTTTYAQLNEGSSKVANALIAAGVKPQQRVGFLATSVDTYFHVLFGCLKARAVLVPLNHRLAAAEIQQLLHDAGLEILCVQPAFLEAVEAMRKDLPNLKSIVILGERIGQWPGFDEWVAPYGTKDPLLPATADDDILQIYTSGTTGLPKGARLSHKNYVAAVKSALAIDYMRMTNGASIHNNPLFHVAGINMAFYALAQGATTYLLERADPGLILDLIEKERTSHGMFLQATLRALTQVPDVHARDLSALRSICYGGSPIAEDLLQAARDIFKNASFNQCYGMTESTGAGTNLTFAYHDAKHGKLRSCGQAAYGFEIRVVGPDDKDMPTGEVGEILLKSDTVTPGYWNRPDVTKNTIRDGWLHTGDAGYLDKDGFLFLKDRIKDMIISGGENIYPAEIENVLSAHPAIADVAVVGVPSAKWGEEPKAFITLRPGAQLSLPEMMQFARDRIAGYKVPKSMEIVDAFPRNASGKILRRELRAQEQQR